MRVPGVAIAVRPIVDLETSQRYRDTRQLVELGLIKSSPAYESHVRGHA